LEVFKNISVKLVIPAKEQPKSKSWNIKHSQLSKCWVWCCNSPFESGKVEYGDAGKSKGEEGQAGPAGFSSWVTRELGRAEALLKVVGSRPDTLADNFFTLMPSGTLPDYQRIIDLKVCFVSTLACPHRALEHGMQGV
jgi:hypothetical protein